jgi:hypothetical protein
MELVGWLVYNVQDFVHIIFIHIIHLDIIYLCNFQYGDCRVSFGVSGCVGYMLVGLTEHVGKL